MNIHHLIKGLFPNQMIYLNTSQTQTHTVLSASWELFVLLLHSKKVKTISETGLSQRCGCARAHTHARAHTAHFSSALGFVLRRGYYRVFHFCPDTGLPFSSLSNVATSTFHLVFCTLSGFLPILLPTWLWLKLLARNHAERTGIAPVGLGLLLLSRPLFLLLTSVNVSVV